LQVGKSEKDGKDQKSCSVNELYKTSVSFECFTSHKEFVSSLVLPCQLRNTCLLFC